MSVPSASNATTFSPLLSSGPSITSMTHMVLFPPVDWLTLYPRIKGSFQTSPGTLKTRIGGWTSAIISWHLRIVPPLLARSTIFVTYWDRVSSGERQWGSSAAHLVFTSLHRLRISFIATQTVLEQKPARSIDFVHAFFNTVLFISTEEVWASLHLNCGQTWHCNFLSGHFVPFSGREFKWKEVRETFNMIYIRASIIILRGWTCRQSNALLMRVAAAFVWGWARTYSLNSKQIP